MMELVMFLVSLAATIVFNVYVLRRFGLTWSLSENYLKLEEEKKGSGILFTVWTWYAGLPLMIALLSVTEGVWFQFLAFFMCAGLIFVGTAANFKEDLTREVHYGGTAVAATAGVLLLVFSGLWRIPAVLVLVAVGMSLKYKRWMYWLEQAVILSVYIGGGVWIIGRMIKAYLA